jgi:hypothetical protein
MTTTAPGVGAPAVSSRSLFRPLGIVAFVICPALMVRVLGIHPNPILGLITYGAAVVAASFLLAWAAEAAQIDVSGGLAVAVLGVIAVLPEYAVDLYYAYTAGHVPEYTQYAAANMTGSNRLLLGLGWSSVVLVALAVAKKRSGKSVRELTLESGYRVELGFLAIARSSRSSSQSPGRSRCCSGSRCSGSSCSTSGRSPAAKSRNRTCSGLPRWAAWTLLALSAVQFALPGQTARYILCGAIALAALIRNRRHILPTLTAPFRRAGGDEDQPTAAEAKDVTPAR